MCLQEAHLQYSKGPITARARQNSVCYSHSEYNVVLNKPDLDTYEYEIWKRDNREMSLMKRVTLSLDEFKEYYYADEQATNYRIINKVIVPEIKKMR